MLATQTLVLRRPKTMRVRFDGRLGAGVTAKDMVLYLIGRIGINGGVGHAVEYAGEAVASLPIEGRLTLCNMSIELGARIGMVAPDDTTFAVSRRQDVRAEGRHVGSRLGALAHIAERARCATSTSEVTDRRRPKSRRK